MSFDIRETRLRNDYISIRNLVDRSDLIHVRATEGNPPEKYLIRFTCKGVEKVSPSGRPIARAFRSRLMIFPDRVFGRLSTNSI